LGPKIKSPKKLGHWPKFNLLEPVERRALVQEWPYQNMQKPLFGKGHKALQFSFLFSSIFSSNNQKFSSKNNSFKSPLKIKIKKKKKKKKKKSKIKQLSSQIIKPINTDATLGDPQYKNPRSQKKGQSSELLGDRRHHLLFKS
jgi:hypothetical protein